MNKTVLEIPQKLEKRARSVKDYEIYLSLVVRAGLVKENVAQTAGDRFLLKNQVFQMKMTVVVMNPNNIQPRM